MMFKTNCFMFGLLLMLVCLVSGCASHFESLPAREEFSKTVIQLEKKYPELAQYNPSFERFIFTPVWDMPYADDLVEKWGEPQEKCLSWWNLCSPFILHNMYRWYWHIEDKTVNVLVDKPLVYGCEPYVFTMKIEGGYSSTVPEPIDDTPAPTDEPRSLSKKLAELKELHDKKLLTDMEYESARTKALEQFNK